MKNIIKLFTPVFCFAFLLACNSDPYQINSFNDSALYGTWSLSKTVTKATVFQVGKKNVTLTFNKDFTLSKKSTLYPSTDTEGSFEYIEDQASLVTTIDKVSASYTIEELTQNELVLSDVNDSSNKIYFVR